jgi:hypothetical protein
MNRLRFTVQRYLAARTRGLAWALLRLAKRIDGAYLNPVWYTQKHSELFFDRDKARCGWVQKRAEEADAG